MLRLKSRSAFTLIELLVVIAIIGLLATLSVIALSNARAKSRDSKRLADIKQMQTSLEMYYTETSHYPTVSEFNSGAISFYSSSTGTTTYMNIIPAAPTPNDGPCSANGNGYIYSPNADGSSYTLSFCIGGQSNSLAAGPKCATPGGIGNIDCSGSGGNGGNGGSGSCTPNCSGKACGDDGCGGSCGSCTGDNTCGGGSVANQCGFTCGTSVVTVTSVAGHACNISAPDYDTCTYNTVLTGTGTSTQCWLKQTMNIGSMVTGVTAQTDNTALEKYCYGNSYNYCQSYGALYQWTEAMQYGALNPGAQGVCPVGWHIPTDAEQHVLENYYTDISGTCDPNRGSGDCAPASATLQGSSLFTNIIRIGGFLTSAGSFTNDFIGGYTWSSTGDGPANAWSRVYSSVLGGAVYRFTYARTGGFSVRCLQN
jgi:general secretion pathway protein G